MYKHTQNHVPRLVSAYQNKMVEENGEERKVFLKQYPGGSFPDFVDYVLTQSKINCRQEHAFQS